MRQRWIVTKTTTETVEFTGLEASNEGEAIAAWLEGEGDIDESTRTTQPWTLSARPDRREGALPGKQRERDE